MHYSSQIFGFSALALISRTSASPLDLRTTVSCLDVKSGLDPSCWAKLNMTGWVDNWYATTPRSPVTGNSGSTGSTFDESSPLGDIGFNYGTPTSSAVATPSAAPGACLSGELWSTCFLRLSLGTSGQDCSKIPATPTVCVAPKAGAPPHTAQIFYAINEYFASWSSALDTLVRVPGYPQLLIAADGPPGQPIFDTEQQKVSIDIPLYNLVEKVNPNAATPGTPSGALLRYLEDHPTTETYGSEDSDIETLVTDLSARLSSALLQIMTDVPTFVQFASTGAFSTTNLVTAAQLVKAIEA
ncbi:MAG: hypothetical protein Q9161_007463 [Pseudevernia consocians]